MEKPLSPPPDPFPRKPRLELPQGSWDCMMHVFGDADAYPLHPSTPYRSAPALAETYLRQQDFLGLSKAVLVNGGGYGTDNRYMLETIECYPQRFRGVTYVEPGVASGELLALREKGLRGARFVAGPAYAHLPELSREVAFRLADVDWHIEFLTFTPGGMAEAKSLLQDLPNAIVIDHFGKLDAAQGLNQPGFTAMLELLDTGRVWVKLSSPGYCTPEDYPFTSMLPYAHALVRYAPQRLLWGSNWPHLMKFGRNVPNDGDLIDLIGEWIPDESTRKTILVDNPDQLYGRP